MYRVEDISDITKKFGDYIASYISELESKLEKVSNTKFYEDLKNILKTSTDLEDFLHIEKDILKINPSLKGIFDILNFYYENNASNAPQARKAIENLKNSDLVSKIDVLSQNTEEKSKLEEEIKSKNKIDEKEGRVIFKQILETVKYCHNQEIIHRDLKPDNILFQDDTHRQIKIIDFGIATLLHDKTRAGSLNYISPEVLSGKDSSSLPSVDIWSIGCILYEMLTGRKMFKGKNKDETKECLLERKVKFPVYLSLEVVDLIDSLCKYHPKERISIDAALNHEWMKNEVVTNAKRIQNCQKLYMKPTSPKRLTLSLSGQIRYSSSIKELNDTKKMKNSLTNRKYLITKIPSEISEDNFFNYNLEVMRKFNGNMPSYMAPIGHNKDQKHSMNQFKDYFNSINAHSSNNNNNGSKSSRGPHYYLSTNGSESKKKLVELPPLNTSPHKKHGSKEPSNISHGSRSSRKNTAIKNYNGKKVMVLKINL